ncbi:MAG TPA: M28 family peptidase [Thermoleophilia bacterium]|nr:M28 family peptidase [Thermoleophilia bacterium]
MGPLGHRSRVMAAFSRTRGGRLALILAAGLVMVVALAATGSLTGCAQSTPTADSTDRPSQAVSSSPYGAVAQATAKVFARSVHPRAADTWGEIRAREFVYQTFQQYGYTPLLQEFIATSGRRRVHSANIIAVKEGKSAEQLVIGAHYDALAGDGYTDNAAGIGLLIELAARLKARETPYTLVFVAFGAKERGQLGSRHFVSAMSGAERRATLGMIDLDGIAGGDESYVFSRSGSATWLRDDVLAAAQDMDIPLEETPARRDTPAGTADLVSDDVVFAAAGVPTATIMASNWAAGRRDGSTQTVAHRRIWDTPRDTVSFVEKNDPGRVREQLSDLSRLLEVILTSELEKHP